MVTITIFLFFNTIKLMHRFGELLYGTSRFYPLYLHVRQCNEYWLTKNRLARLLKHINELFLQFAF